jgi:hypothetical protein
MEERWKAFLFTIIQKMYGDSKLMYSRGEREEKSKKREEKR